MAKSAQKASKRSHSNMSRIHRQESFTASQLSSTQYHGIRLCRRCKGIPGKHCAFLFLCSGLALLVSQVARSFTYRTHFVVTPDKPLLLLYIFPFLLRFRLWVRACFHRSGRRWWRYKRGCLWQYITRLRSLSWMRCR